MSNTRSCPSSRLASISCRSMNGMPVGRGGRGNRVAPPAASVLLRWRRPSEGLGKDANWQANTSSAAGGIEGHEQRQSAQVKPYWWLRDPNPGQA
mgnify:CR=1 FL=1